MLKIEDENIQYVKSTVLIITFILILLVPSCEKNPCDNLVNGIYLFPELPKNYTMTSQQVTEFWDMPQYICDCITTEGLIESCLTYPDLRLIMTTRSPQFGYDYLVKAQFSGIRELESRSDRGTCLLNYYKTIDVLGFNPYWEPVEIGQYMLHGINFLQIILSQYANLLPLTKSEKIDLIELSLEIYEKQKDAPEYYGRWGLICTATVLGRLMYLDSYEPLMQEYNDNQWVRELIDLYGTVDYYVIDLVYALSIDYLIQLKN
jgi:hypothetical protein